MPLDTPEFEAEVEQAIATYADPRDGGHPPALTARVMAAVEARRRKHRWWLGIAVAVPMLSCLIAALFYRQQAETRPQVANNPSVASSPTPVVVPRQSSAPKLEVAQHGTSHHKPRELPKLDQFPTPSAPTEQEQLLMQFTAHAPPKAQQLVAKARTQLDEPLHIAELSIPYLDSDTQP